MINHQSEMLMVTGLARSGTTLLSECLDHHPRVMCISDMMNELLKGFVRYAYYQVENEKKSDSYPLDNLFFSGSKKVIQFINESNLKHKIPAYLRKEIISKTIQRDGGYNPEIIEHIRKCQALSFDLLFLGIMEILYGLYGKKNLVIFGIKTTWCEQLISPLSNTFPNMVFINLLRDPRAVVASNYMSSENTRYPLFVNIRDWRKSVYYSWKYQHQDKHISDKFLSVKYEDLVDNPMGVMRKISVFIGVKYNRLMVESSFKQPNTSYKNIDNIGSISKNHKEKWKEVLSKDFILQIESYCSAEMNRLGYTQMYSNIALEDCSLMSMKQIGYESIPKWCDEVVQNKEYYEETWIKYNSLLELTRMTVLKSTNNTKNSRIINDFFYEKDYFNWLRSD